MKIVEKPAIFWNFAALEQHWAALQLRKEMNIISELEKEEIARISADVDLPIFAAGDTLRVNVKVVEGTRERFKL